MNTFYYVENNQIKTLETIKDFEFIKTKVNRRAYKKIQDIPVPEGYVLNNMTFEKTPEKIIDDETLQLQSDLAQTDTEMARVYEDMMDVLIAKNVFKKDDLPASAQQKIDARKAKRQKLQDKMDLKNG